MRLVLSLALGLLLVSIARASHMDSMDAIVFIVSAAMLGNFIIYRPDKKPRP